MGNRADERERRRQEKLARFEASKPAILARAAQTDQPKAREAVHLQGIPKLAPHFHAPQGAPKALKDGSRFGERMTWCITKSDRIDAWTWGEQRAWSDQEWEAIIDPKLKELAQQTWAELDKHASGSGHKMHHGHEIDDLIQEAQDRWRAIDLEQFETVFRFRLGAKKRAWGYVIQAHFHMVWWERDHRIYTVATD